MPKIVNTHVLVMMRQCSQWQLTPTNELAKCMMLREMQNAIVIAKTSQILLAQSPPTQHEIASNTENMLGATQLTAALLCFFLFLFALRLD